MIKKNSWRLPILAIVVTGGALFWPFPGWTTPIGASIALTNVTVEYQPVASNLSAEAAAIGGLPALPLLNNGHYKDTLAGYFAVTVNLPPLNQQNFWLISDDFSINGQHLFGGQKVFGPISVTGVIDDALAQLSPVLQHIVMTIGNKLLTDDQFAFLGLFDWAYNRDPADDMTGTFALGSTLDLAQLIVGRPVTPLDFTFDFSASAFVIPEPSTILIFASALLGLVALRRRDGDPHRKCPLSGPQGTIFFGKMGDSAEAKAGQERDPPVSSG